MIYKQLSKKHFSVSTNISSLNINNHQMINQVLSIKGSYYQHVRFLNHDHCLKPRNQMSCCRQSFTLPTPGWANVQNAVTVRDSIKISTKAKAEKQSYFKCNLCH